jgi:Ala-tRNA(Pro) deacylase
MKSTPNDLFAELTRLGLAHATIAHPPVFTVEEAKQLRGKIEGGHTKNLFMKDKKDRLFLAVTLEDVPVDLKALGPLIGARGRLSFASADLLREAVNPLNFHPLENTATTAISSIDLLKFVAAQGHEALTLRFPRRASGAISEADQ